MNMRKDLINVSGMKGRRQPDRANLLANEQSLEYDTEVKPKRQRWNIANNNTLENAPQVYADRDRPLNKTVEVQRHGPDETAERLERLDTKPVEVSSTRGQTKHLNLVSPLQIIRQGCISYDSGAINGQDDEPFDDILQRQIGSEYPPPSSRRQKADKQSVGRGQARVP